MKIKIERTKKDPKIKTAKVKISKKQKPRIFKFGTHKKMIFSLWMILILSVGFGIYKNFTAIDQHTTHEKTIITEKLVDTSGIQSYVKSFAKDYFTWENNKESIETRIKVVNGYLTEELGQLNTDLIRSDIPTSSQVQDVQVIKVEKASDELYRVTFTIQQKIKEGKKNSIISSTYLVTVHQDKNGNKVITQNPTMTTSITKSNYSPEQLENDSGITNDTFDEVMKFLETFFIRYPKASNEELAYYVKADAFNALNTNLVFSKIISNILTISKSGNIVANISVEYLDQDTKITQVFQYKLELEKQKNWIIIKAE